MTDFFQAFHHVNVGKELQSIYENTKVTKISMSKDLKAMTIVIRSQHLIDYRDKVKLLYQLKKQIFGQAECSISFAMDYELSSQYTPKTLLESYQESMELELRETDRIYYELYKNSE